MKKIATILLLGIMLFDCCVYRLVINIVQENADKSLEKMLDRNEYDESQLIEIKLPVNIPYQTEQASFERCDGEIEVNGTLYKYVKRKIQYGQVILKCIPNQKRQNLESAKNDLFTLNNDIQQGNSDKKQHLPKGTIVKNTFCDYDNVQQLNIYTFSDLLHNRCYNVYLAVQVPTLLNPIPGEPPEA